MLCMLRLPCMVGKNTNTCPGTAPEAVLLAACCLLHRFFEFVPDTERTRLVDALCANVQDLIPSLKHALASNLSTSDALALQHRNAVQVYAFFLNIICNKAEADSEKGAKEQRQADAEQGARAELETAV